MKKETEMRIVQLTKYRWRATNIAAYLMVPVIDVYRVKRKHNLLNYTSSMSDEFDFIV